MNKRRVFKRSALATAIAATLASTAVMAQESTNVLEEVIVTANAREQNVTDIPYNISAVQGAEMALRQIFTEQELLRSVPGVYIVEKNAFPNSVVEVATAVPAFIGHTEKASDKGRPITKPVRVTSLGEFEAKFGGAPKIKYTLKKLAPNTDADFKVDKDGYSLEPQSHYIFYDSLRWFFQNGPQRVFVALHVAPWVFRIGADSELTNHIDHVVSTVTGAFVDETGAVLLDTPDGVGRIDDRDLELFSRKLVDRDGAPLDDDRVAERVDLLIAGKTASLAARLCGVLLPLGFVRAQSVPCRFHFVREPCANED